MYSGRGRFNNKKKNFNKPKFQKNHRQQKKEYRHQDQLTEIEVGITEYVSKLPGFSGIIKARFSDFHVNEIDLEGTIAKLTDTSAPKDFVSKVQKLDYNNVEKSPIEQLPQEKWDAIKNLVQSENGDPVNLECENLSKDDRTQVHQCIKSYFRQKIVASTVTIEDKKYIQFKKFNKEEKTDNRFQWPDDKGDYVYFLVYKESLDTMDACLKISDCLNISPANFTYAGVKDKRAKTTQWFCVRKVEPWKLMKKTRLLRNIHIGNYTFKDKPLKLGQLQGNKFRIALRNITADNDLLNKSMESLKEHGFINYYGLQRFGNDKEVPTYNIGVHLLLGKWKEAVKLILKPKASDDPSEDIAKAKKIYSETENAKKALEVLANNKTKCIEARLLGALKKLNENDYVNALENIPRNMRLLYIHSFQSLIWNKMVSKRLQLFGLEPVEGDFVFVDKSDQDDKQGDPQEEIDEETEDKNIPLENPDEIDVLEMIPQLTWEMKLSENPPEVIQKFIDSLKKYSPLPDSHKYKKRSPWINREIMDDINLKQKLYKKYVKNKDDELLEHKYKELRNRLSLKIRTKKREYELRMERRAKEEEEAMKCKQEIKVLTAEDLPNYTIYDVVLPLPGYDVQYPENLQQHYKEALEEYGLTLEMTKQRVKTYTLGGTYRKLLEKAKDMSWKIMHYNNPTDNLIRSDFEELKGEQEPKDIKDGKYKALVMEFILPSSSYATMVLREILKTDTSSSVHARLNDYHKSGENRKIIISGQTEDNAKKAEASDNGQGSSLLSDPQKYEEFKSNIFNAIQCPLKRKNGNEEEENECNKKAKTEEKEAEQSCIKMEASLV